MDGYAENIRGKIKDDAIHPLNSIINVLNMMSGNLRSLTLHAKQCEERFKVKVAIFKP